MIVVDTNIITYMTFETRYSGVVSQLHQKNSKWEAPALWKSEFLNVLALYFREGLIDYQETLNALDFAERLIGSREHKVPARDIVHAVLNSTCSSYNCELIVLAEKLGTKLITYDKKLIEEFPDTALTPEAYLE